MRKLNLVFLAFMMVVVLVLSVVIYFVHDRQLLSKSKVLLDQARTAEKVGDLAKSAKLLNRYLSLVGGRRIENEGQTWNWYADVLDKLYEAASPRLRQQVLSAYEQALRFTPEDSKIERRCVEVAMELGPDQINDATTHLANLLDGLDRSPESKEGKVVERAELRELLGDCHGRESKFEVARTDFEAAIEADPTRVSSYDKLARLLRHDLRTPQKADTKIEEAVRTNPASGKAYLCRFKYDRDFGKPAKESDLQRALELSPDDADVLLAAAAFSESKKELKETRTYLEKGLKLYPKREEFALGLVRLELAEQHPDRAETILREAYDHKPLAGIAYELARLLVRQGKIEGENGAEHYVAILRGKGAVGNVLVGLLEPQITMWQQRWNEAIGQIESAQIALRSFPALNAQMRAQLDLMLAECYRHTNSFEQRLAALQNAVDAGGNNLEGPQLALAQELARSSGPGDFERALRILHSLVEKRPELEVDITRLQFRRTLLEPRAERDWKSFESQLKKAEGVLISLKNRPDIVEALTLIRADMLAARDQLDKARTLLVEARSKSPRNLSYVVALSRVALRQGDKDGEALKILDQAEKELGLGRELVRARLAYWSEKGGDLAKAEVAKIAAKLELLPAPDRPFLVEQLAQAELRLGQPQSARQHLNELAALQPSNLQVLLTLFDLALDTGERDEAGHLVERIRIVENSLNLRPDEKDKALGEEASKGTNWRFAKAAYLISQEVSKRPSAVNSDPRSPRERSTELETARKLAEEVALERPQWWGAPLLQGEIALVSGQEEEAISGFLRAFELGNSRPSMVQRLISLLDKKNRPEEINRIVDRLREQGSSSPILKYDQAISAMSRGDFKRGIDLAQDIFGNSQRYVDHLILGRFYMMAGRRDEAGDEFRRAVEQGTGVPETWLTYVKYLVQVKKLEEARGIVDAARKALPPDRSNLPIAEALALVGDFAKAGTLIDEAISQKPNDPATLRLAAGYFLGRNRTREAMDYLNRLRLPATGAMPEDLAWANRTAAVALAGTGRLADRTKALQLVGSNPTSPQDRLLRATILSTDSQLEPRREAIRILEGLDQEGKLGQNDQVLLARLYLGQERDPKKFQVMMLKVLGQGKSRSPQHLALYTGYLIDQKEFDQAAKWLTELKQAEPRGLAALEMEAMFLRARNQEELKAAGKAPNPGLPAPPEVRDLLVAGGQKSPDLIGPVALLLARFGFPTEAEAAYKEFIARDPKRPERLLSLATFLAGQKGRAADALKVLASAWETCPHEQVASAALSLYDAPSVTEDQRKQVEAWLAEASRKQPDLITLANKLGAVWIRQGKFDLAEAKYRQILGSNPEDAEARNNLAWLLALRDSSKIDEAEGLTDGAIGLLGPSSSLLDTKAVVLIRAGKFSDAIEALKTAAAIDPRSASVPLHLAWARQAEGNLSEARKAFEKAVQLGWTPARSDPLERSYIDKLRRELGL